MSTLLAILLSQAISAAEPPPALQPPPRRPAPLSTGYFVAGVLGCDGTDASRTSVQTITIVSAQRLAVSLQADDFAPAARIHDGQGRLLGEIQGVAGAPASGVTVTAPGEPSYDATNLVRHEIKVTVTGREPGASGRFMLGFGYDGDLGARTGSVNSRVSPEPCRG